MFLGLQTGAPTSTMYNTALGYQSLQSLNGGTGLNTAVGYQSLLESVRSTGGSLLGEVDVFDVYEGENIPQGKKSVALRLKFLSAERTLQDGEVLPLRDKIVQTLADRFNAQLRT